MDTKAMKCFRCNLIFINEETAMLHRELLNHPTKLVRLIES